MSERQQHRNPWAEKLSQVSLPDGGESWKAMEALLDREMPRGGRWDKRRWFLLILLLLLLIGVCNCPGRKWLFSGKSTVGGTVAPVVPVVPADKEGKGGPSPGAVGVPARSGNGGGTVPDSGKRVVGTTDGGDRVVGTTDDGKRVVGTTDGGDRVGVPKYGGVRDSGVERRNKAVKAPDRGSAVVKRVKKPGGPTGVKTSGGRRSVKVSGDGNDARPGGRPDSTAGARAAGRPDTTVGTRPGGKEGKDGKGNKVVAKPTATAAKGGEKKGGAGVEKKEDSAKKERQDGWMVGIGLNQFFTVGGQQASSYNSGGITGTLGDYIPVPMVRYYINPKLYVQLEAQINTPQYTKKNLVAVSIPHDSLSPVQYVQRTVAINKLFYFNVPFSVHYNVVDHLDLGAGLQYSRLTNGVGVFNNNFNNNGTDSLESETKSIKGDPAYKEIKTHEFRFLVDANYNWKHFIVGIRYNQALSKFIHVEIAPGQVTQSRNSSVQLYLRYILWDSRKKKSLSAK